MVKFPYYNDYLWLNVLLDSYQQKITDHGSVSGTLTLNFNDGNVHEVTVAGDITLAFSNLPNNVAASMVLIVHHDSTPRTWTWDASIEWVNGTEPDMSGTDITSILQFVTTDGGTTVYGSVAFSSAPVDSVNGYTGVVTLTASDVGAEPTLDADQKRKITISTDAPSGGVDGDIWIVYTE